MEEKTLPRPPPFSWRKYEVRDALPVYPPPGPLSLPPLPSPAREPSFDAPYILTTHLFPACYLRTTRPVPLPQLPTPNASKEDRVRITVEARREIDAARTSKVTDGYPQVLWNCVNRYVKRGLDVHNRTGLTLSFQHGTGFPKEIFEPTLAYLLASPVADLVDEVWAWESIQHGDAGLVNAASASGLFDWMDNGRDIANFLLHYMPKEASDAQLPTHLERVPSEETALRITHGFSDRKFVAIGHSFGGCTSALAATLYPQLFSSLYLIDPVILNPDEHDHLHDGDFVMVALGRRDTWPSRDDALASFRENPFFHFWDPRALQVYLSCGLYATRDTEDKEVVRLKMPGVLEAIVFADVRTEFEVWERLSQLDEKIHIRWAVPFGPRSMDYRRPESTRKRVWLRPENSSNLTILGGSHLIPQEAPEELAEDLTKFLVEQYPSLAPTSIRASL